jgi:hypothetical protein
VLAPVLWVGIRAFIAYDALVNAEQDVSSLKSAVSSNQLQALPAIYSDMRADTSTASAATSDPVWLAAEGLPVVGPNLRAVRQVAQTINSLVVKGVGPIVRVADSFDFSQFRPKHGQIDLARVESLVPAVDTAYRGVLTAQRSANAIDTSRTLGPVTSAVTSFRSVLDTATTEVAAARTLVRQIPPALGSAGPRNYLVVLGTDAEDRASGAAAAAFTLVRIDNGALTIVRSVPASAVVAPPSRVSVAQIPTLPPFAAPTASTSIFDVQRAPAFPTYAAAVATAWTAKFHDQVDVVVSFDSTGLGYLANATGGVRTGSGTLVPATKIAKYLDVDAPKSGMDASKLGDRQSAALADVIARAIRGDGNTPSYLSAANHLLKERRLQLWSAHATLQSSIAATPFAGTLSTSSAAVTSYGLYFDDVDASPTSPYLVVSANLTPTECTSRTHKISRLAVTMRSRSIPVTEDVLAYGPTDFRFAGVTTSGGTVLATHSALVGGQPVALVRMKLPPGHVAKLVFSFGEGGPTPSKVVEVRSSSRWEVTALTFAECS